MVGFTTKFAKARVLVEHLKSYRRNKCLLCTLVKHGDIDPKPQPKRSQ